MKKLVFFIMVLTFIVSCDKNAEDLNSKELLLKSDKSAEDLNSKELLLKKGGNTCITIQSGKLHTSTGTVITPGYMKNGYNYQAHIYNGEYDPGWKLVMKWNDAWLSNMDCNGDGLLDRPANYKGSGAWCTNHWTSTYLNEDGKECNYVEFTKIVAVPADAFVKEGIYFTADGGEIGQAIWGSFAIIESIINDPCAKVNGVQYKSPDHAGLGNW